MIVRKILLVGEVGVGKTSIARRLVFDKYGDIYAATIGVDIYRYEVLPSPGGVPFQFLVWDTDGSYGEGIFRQVYAKQAQAALAIGDISRPSTLETMFRLAALFAETAPGRFIAHIVNKTDLADAETIAGVRARLDASKVPHAMTSAKEGTQVREAFARAAVEILKLEG